MPATRCTTVAALQMLEPCKYYIAGLWIAVGILPASACLFVQLHVPGAIQLFL